jgi:hypothetical protein
MLISKLLKKGGELLIDSEIQLTFHSMLGTRARTYDYDFNIRLKVEDINKSIK